MSATLMPEYTKGNVDQLGAVVSRLTQLPEQLVPWRNQLFRDAAVNGQTQHLDRDLDQLRAVVADLLSLPEHLADRRKQFFRDVALEDRAQALHEGRDEYRQIYDDYIGVAKQFQALADAANSPLATEFERVADEV